MTALLVVYVVLTALLMLGLCRAAAWGDGRRWGWESEDALLVIGGCTVWTFAFIGFAYVMGWAR